MKFATFFTIVWIFTWKETTLTNGYVSSANHLVTKYGYPFEVFNNITTEDGYLLDVFRIPHGKSNTSSRSKPVVMLMHGLTGSARDFLIAGPQRGLAFLLADRNYDVWLANIRGSIYSRKHSRWNPDVDAEFWNFSWHEIGIYDLPALIGFIRQLTQKEQLSYIGLSQGTTAFYVMASMRPEFNKNINVMISLAPVAYTAHVSNPILKFLGQFEPILTPLFKTLGLYELPNRPIPRIMSLATRLFCPAEGLFQELCAAIFILACGNDPSQLDKSLFHLLLEDPSAATLQFMHSAQNVNSGIFRQFDFGTRENLRKYGSNTPPSYNVSNIVCPVALLYGEGDMMVNTKDVEQLCKDLPNCVFVYKISNPLFNHCDFVTAVDIVKLVYENVFKLLEKYNKNVE